MSVTADPIAIQLQQAAMRLRAMLDALEGPISRVLTPEQMSELLSQLMHAGQCMRASGQPPVAEVSAAISSYRVEVERLRALLPSIHSALLRERARLAHEQERLRSITAWAQTSQQTR